MKIRREYDYQMNDEMYKLCNRRLWFTSGTNSQYSKMFEAAKSPRMSCRDVAMIIWTCSDSAHLDDITEEITNIYNEILRQQAEDDEIAELEEKYEITLFEY